MSVALKARNVARVVVETMKSHTRRCQKNFEHILSCEVPDFNHIWVFVTDFSVTYKSYRLLFQI
jgi:hypothetical protein